MSTVVELVHRNPMDVFNERDPHRRAAAIAEVYAHDVVWHEPDRLVEGREALANRAAEPQTELSGLVFQPAGPVSANDDLGHLPFQLSSLDW